MSVRSSSVSESTFTEESDLWLRAVLGVINLSRARSSLIRTSARKWTGPLMRMHEKLSTDSQIIHRGSARLIGFGISVFLAILVYQIYSGAIQSPIASAIGCIALAIPALFCLFADTRHILFEDSGVLYWTAHNGKSVQQGEVKIIDVSSIVESWILRRDGEHKSGSGRIILQLNNGERISLPSNCWSEKTLPELYEVLLTHNEQIQCDTEERSWNAIV